MFLLFSSGGRKFTESGLPDPSMCTCGYDALKPEVRKSSKLIFPLRPTLKVDKVSNDSDVGNCSFTLYLNRKTATRNSMIICQFSSSQ